jgi:2-desacetyl-2-hydroxyethyl bacteriochlorophyllide A dehydrogenase
MKAIIIEKPLTVLVKDTDRPRVDPDQILVRTKVSGVSVGTELHLYDGSITGLRSPSGIDFPYVTYPVRPGYENVGEVVEVGREITGVREGDRLVSCAEHMQFASVPRRDALPLWAKVPDNVTDEEATLAILGTTTAHSIRRAQIQYGDVVVVIGLGVVGMLAAQHAKNAGAGKVIGVDIKDYRLRVADKLHVDRTVDSATENLKKIVLEESDGLGADVVIEAAGSGGKHPATSLRDAYGAVRERGRVVMLGWHLSPTDLIFGADPLIKEADLIMSRGTGPGDLPGEELLEKTPTYARWSSNRNLRYVMDLLSKRKLEVRPLITHRFCYDQIGAVYDMMHEGKQEFLQVILQWD